LSNIPREFIICLRIGKGIDESKEGTKEKEKTSDKKIKRSSE